MRLQPKENLVTDVPTTPTEGDLHITGDQRDALEAHDVDPAEYQPDEEPTVPDSVIEAIEEGEQEIAESETLQSLKAETFEVVPQPEMFSKTVTVLVSIREDRDRTLEQMEADLKLLIGDQGYTNVTTMSGYYILDGTVYYPDSFDPETKTHKPGAQPPPWATRPASRQVVLDRAGQSELLTAPLTVDKPVTSDDSEKKTEEPKAEENLTPTGRKVRSDKGKPRGPRKKVDATPETVQEAAGDLSAAMKDS